MTVGADSWIPVLPLVPSSRELPKGFLTYQEQLLNLLHDRSLKSGQPSLTALLSFSQ